MVLTVSFELSGVSGFLASVAFGYGLSAPGRADMPPKTSRQPLRRQDHTTSPYAATSLVRWLLIAHKSFDSPCNPVARTTLPRPPHPHPASVTIAIRPSVGETARVLELIWGKWAENPKYDLTAPSANSPTGKSAGVCAVAGTAKVEGLTCLCHNHPMKPALPKSASYAVKSVPDVATLILTTLTGAIGCHRIHRS
jgi:hypothetical protein